MSPERRGYIDGGSDEFFGWNIITRRYVFDTVASLFFRASSQN